MGITSQSEQGQVVTLTVDSQVHVMTVEEIGKVSLSDCCEFYAVCLQIHALLPSTAAKLMAFAQHVVCSLDISSSAVSNKHVHGNTSYLLATA